MLGRPLRINVVGMALQRSTCCLELFLTCEHLSSNQQLISFLSPISSYFISDTSKTRNGAGHLVAIRNVAKNCTLTSMFKQNETVSSLNAVDADISVNLFY